MRLADLIGDWFYRRHLRKHSIPDDTRARWDWYRRRAMHELTKPAHQQGEIGVDPHRMIELINAAERGRR